MHQEWPAQSSELWPIEKITPYARNSRTHSDEQVAQIAASIREWGWTNPILVDEDGGLIAGHGRLLAARKLGLTQIPTMVAKSAHRTGANACSSLRSARTTNWPTPRACSGARSSGCNRTEFLRLWPTPQTDSFRSRGGERKDEKGLDRLDRKSVV